MYIYIYIYIISETATALELRQRLICITPSGWWWCTKSSLRHTTHALLRLAYLLSALLCIVSFTSERTLRPGFCTAAPYQCNIGLGPLEHRDIILRYDVPIRMPMLIIYNTNTET